MFDIDEIGTTFFAVVSDQERLDLLNAQLSYSILHSPFYRRIIGNRAHLSCLSELASFPLTDADSLRAAGRSALCVTAGEIVRIVSLQTSGSTGEAKRLYFSARDLEDTIMFFAAGMSWMCAPGDIAAILMPCSSPDGIGDLLCRGLRSIGVHPLPIGLPHDIQETCRTLRHWVPQVLIGLPWHLRLISMICPELHPRAVLLSGDYVPPQLKHFLSVQWNTTVLEHFGMTESGYGCAVQHPSLQEMVLRKDSIIAEVIDPNSLRVLPPGETGELVLTTLHREAQPLLRFRTGDLAALSSNGNISRIFGRQTINSRFYDIQDYLAPLPWLWDYRTQNNCLTAALTNKSPKNADTILEALSGLSVKTAIVASTEIAPFYPNKRIE